MEQEFAGKEFKLKCPRGNKEVVDVMEAAAEVGEVEIEDPLAGAVVEGTVEETSIQRPYLVPLNIQHQ